MGAIFLSFLACFTRFVKATFLAAATLRFPFAAGRKEWSTPSLLTVLQQAAFVAFSMVLVRATAKM